MNVFSGHCCLCGLKPLVSFSYLYEKSLFVDTVNVFSVKQSTKTENAFIINDYNDISYIDNELYFKCLKITKIKYLCYCSKNLTTTTNLKPNLLEEIASIVVLYKDYIIEYKSDHDSIDVYDKKSYTNITNNNTISFEMFKDIFSNEEAIDSYILLL